MFESIATFWNSIFGFIQDAEGVQTFWKNMLEWPIIGAILKFFEVTFGRGATL
ncbi:MAG: hypothetical protein FWC27_11095 [Firmicutes bacterium]|nr:hypothetical protein [Bacillota bacterium]